MSEEIKPKKERRFLKTLGRVGEILVEQVLLKLGSSIIKKIGGKKTLPSILFIFLSFTLFAQYPNTGNKQRLGFQTTADGLTWRGSISDTASIQPINNQNAWIILDTVNLKFYSFDFTSNVWNLIGNSAAFTQPVDSLFFNVNVPTNNVDTAKMRWDSDLATVVLGLNDNVPNELGFKNFWLVKNQTGSTITKGSLVYANGTLGVSGRITVAKFIANGSIDAKYLLGITAHDLSNGEDGYVISFGKIRKINTDTFAAGAILYPSPTVAGVWTDVEPIAPNIDMPIGFCINSHANNGTIAIRVASGYKLSELHDVAISSPVEKASLYYSGGLWRDTTATLLVSDTALMLTNYLRSGIAASTYLPLTGGTVTGNTNFVPTTGRVIFGSSSETWDEILGVNPRSTTSLGLGVYSNSLSYSGSLFRAQSENSIGSSYMLYEGRSAGGLPAFWVKGDGSSYFEKNITIGSEVNNDALDVHHDGDHGIRMSYLTAPSAYNFSIKPKVTAANVRYVFSQTNNNIFYDSVFVLNQGNIGINKLNPSYKLDVNGTLGVTGATTLGSTLAVTGAVTATRFNPTAPTATGTGMFAPTSTSLGFSTNGTNRMTLDNRGNIGVGTTPNTDINSSTKGFQFAQGGSFLANTNLPILFFGSNIITNETVVVRQVDGRGVRFVVNSLNGIGYDFWVETVPYGVAGTSGTPVRKISLEDNGNFGIGDNITMTQKLDVDGNARIRAVGSTGGTNSPLYVTSTGVLSTNSSDVNKKHNVRSLPYGLNTINQLNPVAFDWNETDETDIGFIAQDIESIIPESVITNWDSQLIFKQEKIVPILVKAIQEQNALIKALEQRLLILENK